MVQVPNGVAVLATNYWAALQGKKALQIEWDAGENATLNTATQIEDYKKLADSRKRN